MVYAMACAVPGSGTPAAGADEVTAIVILDVLNASRVAEFVYVPIVASDCRSGAPWPGATTAAVADGVYGELSDTRTKAIVVSVANSGNDHERRMWRPERSPLAVFTCARRIPVLEYLVTERLF